jgi:hypothetical protein
MSRVDESEVIEVAHVPVRLEPTALEAVTRAEIDIQVATAKRFPRSVQGFLDEAKSIACRDAQTAASCIYALPRGKNPDGTSKTIEGPSVRLAEIAAYTFANLRITTRITQQTERFLVAQATAIDLEKNVGAQIEIRRRITDAKGRPYNDDMIVVTANAAISIAYRNAVWKVIPAALVSQIYRACRKLAGGEGRSIDDRRASVRQWIDSIGVSPSEMFDTLGVKGWEDIGLEQMAILAGFMTAIEDGETTADAVFRPRPEGEEGHPAQPIGKIERLKGKIAPKGKKPETAELPLPADDKEQWEEGRE